MIIVASVMKYLALIVSPVIDMKIFAGNKRSLSDCHTIKFTILT